MRDDVPCPSSDELTRYRLGQLPEGDTARLRDHVRDCPRCGATPTPDPNAGGTLAVGSTTLPPRATPELSPLSVLAPAEGPGEIGRLGPYRVLRVLATGGMGVVFEAEDTRLDRRIALKVMRPGASTGRRARERFLREAQATAALAHDNIVRIHKVGEEGGVLYLAMQLLQGETLHDRLERDGNNRAVRRLKAGMPGVSVRQNVAYRGHGAKPKHVRGLRRRPITVRQLATLRATAPNPTHFPSPNGSDGNNRHGLDMLPLGSNNRSPGGLMRRLRKTATALLVWATAVSSLIGSTPHFTCRCPDGTIKPFCTGQGSSESSCCCNGKCCCSSSDGGGCCKSSSTDGKKKKSVPSCCQQGKPETSSEGVAPQSGEDGAPKSVPDPRSGDRERLTISRTCCQKTLAKAEGQTLVRPLAKPVEHLEPGLAFLPPLNVGVQIPSLLGVRNDWQVYRLPPPTDLVIAFQHFVI